MWSARSGSVWSFDAGSYSGWQGPEELARSRRKVLPEGEEEGKGHSLGYESLAVESAVWGSYGRGQGL